MANPHPGDPVPAAEAYILTQTDVSRIQGFPVGWDWSAPSADSRDVDQMIANAVPSGLAEAIGKVILARDAGESIPAIPGRFSQWLRRSKGFSRSTMYNAKSRVNRVRRLLGGRTFGNSWAEMEALEGVEEFKGLATGTQSDLRKALRLYREWMEQPKRTKKVEPAAEAVETVEQVEAVAA